MRAAVVHTLGKAPKYDEFEAPTAGDGEVLIKVSAAALTNLTRLATTDPDYSEGKQPPFIAGVEGVGTLPDGKRVAFGARRAPFGTLAEYSVSPGILLFEIPDEVDDTTAAALLNPALSSWLPLSSHIDLQAGETVLVVGATGVAGKLAVQISKLLGAGRVVAAGRNPEELAKLPALGADAVISLDQDDDQIAAQIAEHGANGGYNVILDYLWGHPAEVVLGALPRSFAVESLVRYLQIGNSAGQFAKVGGNALRRSGASIIGSGSMPGLDEVKEVWRQLMVASAAGKVTIDTELAPLSDIDNVWYRETPGRRVVVTI